MIWEPSGAGKTVTLKIIAGLFTPDAGHIEIGGRVLYDAHTRIRHRTYE
ncbi:MAG: ATP-binding cassette domain-containing protein [Armatimonadota bacterium]